MTTKSSSPTKKRRSSPHVPEQYRGFALQPTRMAMLLLDADEGSLVSLELIDDVGVENSDETKLASQTKSVRKTNPVSDKSPALWRTFANWANDVRTGRLEASKTTFELYVNRQVSGDLVSRFHHVSTKQQALEVFGIARDKLWGAAPKFPERRNQAATLAPYLDEVFGAGARAFREILPRFRLNCAFKNPALDLHAKVASWLTISEEVAIDLVCHLHGWLKERVDEQLEAGKAPVIARDDFRQELRAYYGRLVPSGALPDLAPKPTPDELMRLLPFTFVQQLKLVDVDRDSLAHAMTCYFKAARVRTIWGERALVHEESLDDLTESLMQVWRNYRIEVFANHSGTDEVLRGQLLQIRCNGHRCPVEGKDVPEYFVPGCFHALADLLSLGWHPRYSALLATKAA